jgi:hypothetical protein
MPTYENETSGDPDTPIRFPRSPTPRPLWLRLSRAVIFRAGLVHVAATVSMTSNRRAISGLSDGAFHLKID